MENKLKDLQPNAVWDFFYQLTQVPRPSKHEEAIQAFMIDFGKSLGLETVHDDAGNVIISKPATAGYEDRKGVVLQSHLDMVPQANSDVAHNFATDPIKAYVDGDWVTAEGTTLGADNGIGVAAIMAILASKDIPHGPIEALFTSDEETGMGGAQGLQPNVLKGDILLNLDSEDEKELYIGCAGGVDATFTLPIAREATNAAYAVYRIDLKGLKGGHSGVDIHLQRANANKLLARALISLENKDWQLIQLSGGNLRNAIPRESFAIIAIDAQHGEAMQKQLADFEKMINHEYKGVENKLSLRVEKQDSSAEQALTAESKTRLLNALNACPNGVHRICTDMDDLIETSSNLAIVNTEENHASIACLLRSSLDSARAELELQMRSLFALAGASSLFDGAYPGWQPNPDSEILQVMQQTGKDLFGKNPKQCAIHAGLECGLLGGIYPNWDMISFGPTIRFPHSPDEKVHIASVGLFFDWLVVTLKAIPKKAS